MFTYYPANTTAAQPELVNAIAQGLHAEHGAVTEDDILMELTSGWNPRIMTSSVTSTSRPLTTSSAGETHLCKNLLSWICNLRGYISFA